MPTQPKVAIYARVSTDEQSPDAQLRDLREYIHNRGWERITEYIDVGESGSKDSRPAWNELWEAIRRRRIHVLVIPAIDRVGRSLPHLVKILSTIGEQNVTLISLREAFDLSTAQGRMLAGLFAVLADYELSVIRERTKAGMRSARAKGRQIGPKKRYFDVRKATALRHEGVGIIKIAKELGGIGVQRVQQWAKYEYVSKAQRLRLASSVTTMDCDG